MPGAGHAQDDSLHDAHVVGPEPGLPMDVVTEDDGVLPPGFFGVTFVALRRNHQGRMGPLLLPPGAASRQEPHTNTCASCGDDEIEKNLFDLTVGVVIAGAGDVPDEPACQKEKTGNENLQALEERRVFGAVGKGGPHRCTSRAWFRSRSRPWVEASARNQYQILGKVRRLSVAFCASASARRQR